MTRRSLLARAGAALALLAGLPGQRGGQASAAEQYEVNRSDAEWMRRLTPDQYRVLREGGTETAFTSQLDHEWRAGTYSCAGCQLPLFSSTAKFDSGTGWPSFWAPLTNAVLKSRSGSAFWGTEVHCRRCGGHLGHVFEDGPKPTGLRYCINGVALEFKPIAPKAPTPH